MSSTVSASCQTDDCPLRGAAYASITHFDSEITTLTLEKEFFEEGGQGIVEYSDVLTKVNDRRGVFVTEKMVNHLYTTEVLELWDFGAPMASAHLQLDCPLMKRFWEKRTSPETFDLRNSNDTHHAFRWSNSQRAPTERAMDKGTVMMDNGARRVAVPMIGLISQLEELNFHEVRKEIENVNPRMRHATMVGVLAGILEHVYYDPLRAVRDEKHRNQIDAIRAAHHPPTRRHKAKHPAATGQRTGPSAPSSEPSIPGALVDAMKDQDSTKVPSTQVSSLAKESQEAQGPKE